MSDVNNVQEDAPVGLGNLRVPKGANRGRKRVGRGQGSTWGKTCGKGQKGQKARAGGGIPAQFEGGQMPLNMRVPKRGFTNIFAKEVAIVNLGEIEAAFDAGAVVDLDALFDKGLIPARRLQAEGEEPRLVLKADAIKILGNGALTKSLTVKAHRFSKSAKAAIEAAGGTVEILG